MFVASFDGCVARIRRRSICPGCARANLLAALKESNWRVYGADGAAALLGVKPSTLASRIKKMGLEKPS